MDVIFRILRGKELLKKREHILEVRLGSWKEAALEVSQVLVLKYL